MIKDMSLGNDNKPSSGFLKNMRNLCLRDIVRDRRNRKIPSKGKQGSKSSQWPKSEQ